MSKGLKNILKVQEGNDLQDNDIRMSPNLLVNYTLNWWGDDFEIVEKEVVFDKSIYNDYDSDSLWCFETLDLEPHISDRLKDTSYTGIVRASLSLEFSYHKDYYGECDVEWGVEVFNLETE